LATCLQKGVVSFLIVSTHWACVQTVTEYRFTPDFGLKKLMQDKEECQALQRAVGNDEDRIEKCLEAKGWLTIKKEVSTVSLDDSVGSSTQY
jgi:hypothetical protein